MIEILLLIFIILSLLIIKLLTAKREFTGGVDTKMSKKSHKKHQSNFDLITNIVNHPEVDKLLAGTHTIMDFSEIETSVPYFGSHGLVKTTLHNGQLKLFLTELEFLTEVLPKHDDKCFVVYAGSSPSHKLSFLADMFPGVCFICVDPNEHLIMFEGANQYDERYINKFYYFIAAGGNRFVERGERRINPLGIRGEEKLGSIPDDIVDIIAKRRHTYYMIEDYMTDELSEKLAPLSQHGDVYFISDIRSRSETYEAPSDLDILWNSAMMYNWLKLLVPKKFMLKFHAPYTITSKSIAALERDYQQNRYTHEAIEKCKDIDFLGDYRQRKFRYIAPEHIYIQAFAGQSSTETRLVASRLDVREYNVADYEDKFCYYNRIRRPFGWHTDHAEYIDSKLSIDHCGDCALMCKIFENYWKKYYGAANPQKIKGQIRQLLYVIRRDLKSKGVVHGAYMHQFRDKDELLGVLETLNAQIVVEENFNPSNTHVHEWTAADCAKWYAVYEYLLKFGKENAYGLYNSCKIIDLYGFNLVSRESVISRATRLIGRKEAEDIWDSVNKILRSNQKPTNFSAADIYEMPENPEDICGENWLKLVSNAIASRQIDRIILLTGSNKYEIKLPAFDGEVEKYYLCDTTENFFEQKFADTDLVLIRIPGAGQILRVALIYFCKKYVSGVSMHLTTTKRSNIDLFYTPMTDFVYVYNDIGFTKTKTYKITMTGDDLTALTKDTKWLMQKMT